MTASPEANIQFACPPLVNFSVQAQDDVSLYAGAKNVSSAQLHNGITQAIRRHGLGLTTVPTIYNRWRTMVCGLDVLYDIGPHDTVMVVQVSKAPAWLEETYASQDGDGGRLGIVQSPAHPLWP